MSPAEIRIGLKLGLIDAWPMVRRHRPAGSWEKRHVHALAKPSPWEGLL